MTKPLSNRALVGDGFGQGQKNLGHLIPAKTAKALVASLILHHGSLELDRLIRACRLDGRPRHLTGNEYRLLEFLLLHRGEVRSENELMRHVWQKGPSSINLVSVHIVSLRKKLGYDIARTVRGKGYTIDAERSDKRSVVSNHWSLVTDKLPSYTSGKDQS